MSLTDGAWLSLVERCVRDAEVACSNHVAPSRSLEILISGLFFIFKQVRGAYKRYSLEPSALKNAMPIPNIAIIVVKLTVC